MEPRPPRPRSSHPFETPGSPETAGIGERLYPAPGESAYYPGAETLAPGAPAAPPLLPRRQRRQRRALRGVAVAVVLIGAVAAMAWVFRDAVQGLIPPAAPSPAAEALVTAPGTPAAAPESAALPNALATVTPTAEPRSTATPEPEEEASAQTADATEPPEPDRDISAQTMPLLELLPTQDQVPAGLVLVDEAERSKDEVIAALGGTEEAAQLLDDWGWSGNAFRDFIADDTTRPAGGDHLPQCERPSLCRPRVGRQRHGLLLRPGHLRSGAGGSRAAGHRRERALAEGCAGRCSAHRALRPAGADHVPHWRIDETPDGDPTADVLTVAGEIIAGQAAGD